MKGKRKANEITKTVAPTSNGHRRQHGEARRLLPVYKFRSEICKLVKENEVVLVIAETVSLSWIDWMTTCTFKHLHFVYLSLHFFWFVTFVFRSTHKRLSTYLFFLLLLLCVHLSVVLERDLEKGKKRIILFTTHILHSNTHISTHKYLLFDAMNTMKMNELYPSPYKSNFVKYTNPILSP